MSNEDIIDLIQILQSDTIHSGFDIDEDPDIIALRNIVKNNVPPDQWPENTKLLVQAAQEDFIPHPYDKE